MFSLIICCLYGQGEAEQQKADKAVKAASRRLTMLADSFQTATNDLTAGQCCHVHSVLHASCLKAA